MKRLTQLAAGLGSFMAARAVVRRLRAFDVTDKVVLVTGGSRGLGLVIARELLARGARVAICARDEDELARAQALLAELGPVLAVTCDVTDQGSVEQLVALVRDELGPIDCLINNAGIIQVGPMELMTVADYERAMETHYWGPLYATLAVLPEMRLRREGHIVNIASIGGKLPVPHLLPYTASKFALVGLSSGMREELAPDGITVTTVCPGLMRTGSPINAEFKGKHREEFTWFSLGAATPLTSLNAERAASRIIDAMCRGDAELVLSVQAKLATKLYALAPGFLQDLLAVVDRMLPSAGGIGTESAKGRDSASQLAPSRLTRLSNLASVRNNEV